MRRWSSTGPGEARRGSDVSGDVHGGGVIQAGDVGVVEDVRRLQEELGTEAFLDREGAAVTQVDFKGFRRDERIAADVEGALETGGGGGIAIEYAVAGHIEVFSGLGVHQEGESVVIHEVVPG